MKMNAGKVRNKMKTKEKIEYFLTKLCYCLHKAQNV